jgi:hypothetical protein
MGCTRCQNLESKLNLLGAARAETTRIRKDRWNNVRPSEFGSLRSAENDAMLKFEIARAELNQHKRNEHGTG